ncbi:quinone-dependent dihydroorotate dehydrogenase [soil metagenome]
MYRWLRNILFWFDAEQVHYFSMNMLRFILNFPFAEKIICRKYTPEEKGLVTNGFGLQFKNPVGLGAGFDKNAKYLRELSALGFGFVEIGTVTPLPQKGNPRPRLFRLPADRALINRMGFNNEGSKKIAARLKVYREGLGTQVDTQKQSQIIIGGNIGKNKATPNEEAWRDYMTCFEDLFDYVDYFVVNVSSPNTPGLRELQHKDFLLKILSALVSLNMQKANIKPLLLKISPDLNPEQFADAMNVVLQSEISGIVVANTTISRDSLITDKEKINKIGEGGLSGKPLSERSNALCTVVNKTGGRNIPVIASGGIFNGKDAMERIRNGALLVQVWTGFIYEGPSIVKNICATLLKEKVLKEKLSG